METSITVSPVNSSYYSFTSPSDISLADLFVPPREGHFAAILHNKLQNHNTHSETPPATDQHYEPLENSNYYSEKEAQQPPLNEFSSEEDQPRHSATASANEIKEQQPHSHSEDSEEKPHTFTEQRPSSAPIQSKSNRVEKQATVKQLAPLAAEIELSESDASSQSSALSLHTLPEHNQSPPGASTKRRPSIAIAPSDSMPRAAAMLRDGATLQSPSASGKSGDPLAERDPSQQGRDFARPSQQIRTIVQERHSVSPLQSRELTGGDTTTQPNPLLPSNETEGSNRSLPLQVIARPPLTENTASAAPAQLINSTTLDETQQEFQQFFRTAANDHIIRHARFVIRSNQEGEIHLLLKPEELGTMRINLHLQNNLLNGRILVEHPTARTLVEQNLSELLRAFREQGIDVGTLDVALNHHSTPSFLANPFHNQSMAEYDLALRPVEAEEEQHFMAEEIEQTMLINLYA